MGGIFNYSGPLMSGLGKIADLVILNLLTVFFCIPIVTIGASLTACHYTSLKIRRGEGYVLRNFWKSFKENLGQSIVLWFIYAIHVSICLVGIMFYKVGGTVETIVRGILLAVLLCWAFASCWLFPLQSKFINKIGTTMKYSFFIACKYLLHTICMLVIHLLSMIVFLTIVLTRNFQWLTLPWLFGFSVPAYLCAMLYDKKFQEIEDKILERRAQKVEMEN